MAVHLDSPAHSLDVGFDQIQAYTAAGMLRMEPLVETEYVPARLLHVNAGAVISECNYLLPGLHRRLKVYLQGPLADAVFDGIGQQVEKDAVKVGPVCPHCLVLK